MRRLSLIPAAMLAACAPEASPPPPGAEDSPPAATPDPDVPVGSTPIARLGDLLGEYRVAGIDGEELGGDQGIAVSIDGPILSFEPTCAGFVWNIAEDGSDFVFTRAPGYGPTRQTDGSVMVCAVAVPSEFHRLGQAIDAARGAWRTPANGVLLEGGGRSVLLFSQ